MPHSDPEKRREYQRRYYALNRDRILEREKPRQRAAYKANPQPKRLKARDRYAADPERFIRKSDDWRRNNPEKRAAQHARHYEKHSETIRARVKNYYAKNKDARIAAAKRYINDNPDVKRRANENYAAKASIRAKTGVPTNMIPDALLAAEDMRLKVQRELRRALDTSPRPS